MSNHRFSSSAFMMLAAIPAGFLAVAACSTTADGAPPVSRSAGICTADQVGQFVGQPAGQEVGAQILRSTGARTFRWLPEGTMVTMEYRADRVNVDLDTANKIKAVRCG